METLLLFIFIILIISIILVSFGLVYYYCIRKTGSGKGSSCSKQSDCALGYVCSNGICSSGLGTACLQNSDCVSGLVCSNGICAAETLKNTEEKNIKEQIVEPNNLYSKYVDYFKDNKTAYNSITNDTHIDAVSEDTEVENFYQSNAIDACNYSNYSFYVLKDGYLQKKHIQSKNAEKIESNIRPLQLAQFSGYLYCLSNDNTLYVLNNDTILSKTLIWEPCIWCPIKPTHISSTLDFSHLWVQNNNVGYLLNTEKNVVSTVEINNFYRKYGKNFQTFLDCYYNDNKIVVQPNNAEYFDCLDAVLDDNDTLISIDTSDNYYNKVVLLNWEPFFIRKYETIG